MNVNYEFYYQKTVYIQIQKTVFSFSYFTNLSFIFLLIKH